MKENSKIGSTDKEKWKEFLSNHHDDALKINKKYCGLPKKFQKQIYDYLPKKENLLKDLKLEGGRNLCILHADLCDENILLIEKDEYNKDNTLEKRTFATNDFNYINNFPIAIIDFGDSRIGDPVYDFVAIYLSALRCDKYLLRIFLFYYTKSITESNVPLNLPPAEDFSYIAMCYTLLNESPALKSALCYREELGEMKDLKEMEKCLWDFNSID